LVHIDSAARRCRIWLLLPNQYHFHHQEAEASSLGTALALVLRVLQDCTQWVQEQILEKHPLM
jgi:hypothetical protein